MEYDKLNEDMSEKNEMLMKEVLEEDKMRLKTKVMLKTNRHGPTSRGVIGGVSRGGIGRVRIEKNRKNGFKLIFALI